MISPHNHAEGARDASCTWRETTRTRDIPLESAGSRDTSLWSRGIPRVSMGNPTGYRAMTWDPAEVVSRGLQRDNHGPAVFHDEPHGGPAKFKIRLFIRLQYRTPNKKRRLVHRLQYFF